jgi:nucleoside-diphosphate-sugar epimerase
VIGNVTELQALLSDPQPAVVEAFSEVSGDIIILGAAGKMGPSLARMAQRASQAAGVGRKVYAVSRFSNPELLSTLQAAGVSCLPCDLLNDADIAKLPEAPNVFFMAGRKFGAEQDQSLTWAMNAWVPALVCKKFPRSRIIVFSTGNVYGLSQVAKGGSLETDPLHPEGEYAMSCLGRERIFQYFSRTQNLPMTILRINYASELRYGVIVDLAQQVLKGEPIDLAMGHFNTIWLADANAMALRALAHVSAPPTILNITGAETLRVRDAAERLAQLMACPAPKFTGSEASTALLSNASKACKLFGSPSVPTRQLLSWVADWLLRKQPLLGKRTYFQTRDGIF